MGALICIALGLVLMVMVVVVRLKFWNDPESPLVHGPLNRAIVLICCKCGAPKRISEISEETVGGWGDKYHCDACEAKKDA